MQTEPLGKGIAILLLVAVSLAFAANHLSPNGIALVGQWDLSQGAIRANAKTEQIFDQLEIDDIRQAKRIFDAQGAVFVDARPMAEYREGHVKNAIAFPLGEFEQRIEAFLDKIPPDRPIITYCSGRMCTDSHHLAQMLMDMGYQHVSIMIDGYPGWQEEGYPIEQNSEVD
jgi:rhodanese-related sulfurtransferase